MDTRALFGAGVYATRFEPAQLSRPKPRTRHSGTWPRVCCIAIIVPERMAYQTSVRATPEMTQGPGRDIYGRPLDPESDLWVIRCSRGVAHAVENAAANAELRWRQIVRSLEDVYTPRHVETSKAAMQLSDILHARGKHHEAELILTRASDGRSVWRSAEMSGESPPTSGLLVSSQDEQFPGLRLTPQSRNQHEEKTLGPSNKVSHPGQNPNETSSKFRADPFGEGNTSAPSSVSNMIVKFKSCNGVVFDVTFVKQPLGIDFDRTSPVVVRGIFPGSHAEFMKVEVGWTVVGVNSESMIGQEFSHVFSKLVSAESVLAREVHMEGIVPNLANWRSELFQPPAPNTKCSYLLSGKLSASEVHPAPASNPESIATLPPDSSSAHPTTTLPRKGVAADVAMVHHCVGGHELKSQKAYIWGVCDVCDGSVSQGDFILECIVCSPIWWMCVKCRDRELGYWKVLGQKVPG